MGPLAAVPAIVSAAEADPYAVSPWRKLSDAEWKRRPDIASYNVLRREATELAGTSPLNKEKRGGTFVCVGCALPLFKSDWKFESGTGWPSLGYTYIKGALATKKDFSIGSDRVPLAPLLWSPRPRLPMACCSTWLSTGNNGDALRFVPA